MRAIIAGAGIAGLTVAYELGLTGWDVVLVEKAPRLRDGGYMIDFFGPGYDAAEENGLLKRLAKHAYPIEGVELVHGDGRKQAWMDYGSFRRSLGGRLFSLMRGDIEQELRAALPERVGLRFGKTVEKLREFGSGVEVTLTDGELLHADLLVGADGIHSETRAALFGPEQQFLRYLGFHTAAYLFPSEAIGAIAAGRFVMLSVPNRQMGLLRTRDGRAAVYFIWRDARPERAGDARAAIAARFGDMGWLVPDIIAAAPENREIYYDVVAQAELDQWHKGRVVLIGDAAYAVSLLAGQGASLAVGGAHVLVGALDACPDVGAALAEYQRTLQPEAVKKQAAGRRTAEWIVPSSPLRVWIRATVFNLSSLPFVSRIIGGLVAASPKGALSSRPRRGRRSNGLRDAAKGG